MAHKKGGGKKRKPKFSCSSDRHKRCYSFLQESTYMNHIRTWGCEPRARPQSEGKKSKKNMLWSK